MMLRYNNFNKTNERTNVLKYPSVFRFNSADPDPPGLQLTFTTSYDCYFKIIIFKDVDSVKCLQK